jgi:hypothetical protein
MRFEPMVRIGKDKDGEIFYYAGIMKIQEGKKPQYYWTNKHRDLDTAMEYAIKDASRQNHLGVDYYDGMYDGYYASDTDTLITDPEEVKWMENIAVLFKKN